MFLWLGRMAVTPVRTGPRPRRSGPAGPRMMVECPTSTPSTSVMAFHFPGLKRPSGIPSSRARTRCSTPVLYPDSLRNAIVDALQSRETRRTPTRSLSGLCQRLRRGRRRYRRRAIPVEGLREIQGPRPGPPLPLPLLVAADRSGEDLRDQRVVLDARRLGDEHQVAPSGSEAGERVALEEVDLALLVNAEVDARHVAAAERDEALPRGALQALELRRLEPGGHVVPDLRRPVLLELERVHRAILALVEEDHLHQRKHFRPALAQHVYGDPAPA